MKKYLNVRVYNLIDDLYLVQGQNPIGYNWETLSRFDNEDDAVKSAVMEGKRLSKRYGNYLVVMNKGRGIAGFRNGEEIFDER